MESALTKVGLPVKCRTCGTRAFVKPNSDYDGWWRIKIMGKPVWYCPEDVPKGQGMHSGVANLLETMTPLETSDHTVDELYKLLD